MIYRDTRLDDSHLEDWDDLGPAFDFVPSEYEALEEIEADQEQEWLASQARHLESFGMDVMGVAA